MYKIDTTPSNDLKQPLLAKMYLGKPREDLDEFIQAVHDTGLGNIRPLLKEEPREVMKRKMYQTVAAPLYLIKFRENGETVGVAVRELDTRRFNAIEKFYGNKIVDNLHTSTLAAIRLVRLVSAIHQRGFVIGDFSASNVLIDLEGHIAATHLYWLATTSAVRMGKLRQIGARLNVRKRTSSLLRLIRSCSVFISVSYYSLVSAHLTHPTQRIQIARLRTISTLTAVGFGTKILMPPS